MEPGAWVALAAVFVLGAMSPGPSLAVVLRNTMSGGRSQGVATGIGHGIGFGIYAFSASAGIATALSGPYGQPDVDDHAPSGRTGFIQGFLIALLNPKILAWMLAIYAPFIEADIPLQTLMGMGLMGTVIDGTWYVTVATVLTRGDGVSRLRSQAHRIDGAMGVLMFVFAALLMGGWL